MIFFAMIANVFATFLTFAFAKRWNKNCNINDIVFLFFTDVVFNVIQTVLYSLPLLALFAKVCPAKIEGTIFAFLTGTMNLASTVIQPGMGTLINKQFVGVSKKDLSGYSTLCLIAFICSLVTFVLLPLIPTKKQLADYKQERTEQFLERKRLRKERRGQKSMDPEAMMLMMDQDG